MKKVKLKDLPQGSLFSHNGCIALKTEYLTKIGTIGAYIVGSGEFFWGGTTSAGGQRELLVTPVDLPNSNESNTALTDAGLEKQALDTTAKLWNILILLKEVHPDDIHEHRRDIHNIQNRIMARCHKEQKWSKDGN